MDVCAYRPNCLSHSRRRMHSFDAVEALRTVRNLNCAHAGAKSTILGSLVFVDGL